MEENWRCAKMAELREDVVTKSSQCIRYLCTCAFYHSHRKWLLTLLAATLREPIVKVRRIHFLHIWYVHINSCAPNWVLCLRRQMRRKRKVNGNWRSEILTNLQVIKNNIVCEVDMVRIHTVNLCAMFFYPRNRTAGNRKPCTELINLYPI